MKMGCPSDSMIKKRETKQDLVKQTRLFEVFSKHIKSSFNQFSSFSSKYRIDGYCYNDKEIVCWVECKWYNNNAHCLLNVPKFNELIQLSETTMLPSYLVFREHNKWGFILLHDGNNIICSYTTKLMGGTPKGRTPNIDDVEPLICLDKSNIEWGN